MVPDEQTPPYNGLGGVNGIGLFSFNFFKKNSGLPGDSLSRTFQGCLCCGPGARTFCAKSIGRAGPIPGGFDRLPQDAAGRSKDRPLVPTRRVPLHRRFKRLARLIHEMEAASWFLHRRSLPLGLAPDRKPPLPPLREILLSVV